MDWMLPGVPATGRPVEVPLVVVVQLSGDEIVCERIYWDQASVLVQLGLIESAALPVVGAEAARKVLDPSRPSNDLILRIRAGHEDLGAEADSAQPSDRDGRSYTRGSRPIDLDEEWRFPMKSTKAAP
ncbi:MAG: hypothetical protein ACREX4_15300 [Gammaproteobacteria bacterium]